eukprot:361118-Chlamydomonas_euryale.AAC.3
MPAAPTSPESVRSPVCMTSQPPPTGCKQCTGGGRRARKASRISHWRRSHRPLYPIQRHRALVGQLEESSPPDGAPTAIRSLELLSPT